MSDSSPGIGVRAGRNLLAGGAALILLTSCAGEEDPSGSSPSSSSPIRTAADGTDLEACKDGKCEVKVNLPARIPVAAKFEVAELTVESGGDDRLRFTASAPEDGPIEVCGRTCGGAAGKGASAGASASAGERVTANRLAVDVLTVTKGSAILRLSPG